MANQFVQRVKDMLAESGGLYEFDDIVAAVMAGDMQSFAVGETWVVTRICEFPRKRTLNIVMAVGNLEQLREIESEVVGFAKEHGCKLMFADARLGFDYYRTDGWRKVSATYVKDLEDGS